VLGFALSIAALCIPTAVQAQTEASAANDVCTTYYINNAAYDVADMLGANARAALMAGLMSAVLPIGIGLAKTTVNDSEKEQTLKQYIDIQEKINPNIKYPVEQIYRISDIKSICFNLIQVTRSVIKISGPNGSEFEQTLYYTTKKLNTPSESKSVEYSEIIQSPYKSTPRKRYERNKKGRYVEIVNPVEDPIVQFGRFFISLRKAEAKIIEKIVKKQAKK
jgi:hypothetical protein